MSDYKSSSHDDGELSDDSNRRSGLREASYSDEDRSSTGGRGAERDMESEMRAKLLNKLQDKKSRRPDIGDEDEDERFTIQPRDAQRAKDQLRTEFERTRDRLERDGDREKKKDKERREHRTDRKQVRDVDPRQREKDIRGRYERSGRPATSRHEDRHKRHDERRGRGDAKMFEKDQRDVSDRGEKYEKRKKDRRDEKEKKHERRRNESSTDEDRPKRSYKKSKDSKTEREEETNDDVIEVQEIEASPVELKDGDDIVVLDDAPITSFTLDSPAGPNKYSKFDSTPESEADPEAHEGGHSPGPSDVYSDVDEDVEMKSTKDEEEEIEAVVVGDETLTANETEANDENVRWQDLSQEQREMLSTDARKRLQAIYQKDLIKKLPVFYPGIMGCRNVNEFECVNRVDEGTFGVVYRAKDKRTDEIVALKRLKMEKEKHGFPITALREINMLLKAGQHPNIVNVKEILVGSNMDKIYLAMEFVEHDMKSLMDTMYRKNKRFSTGEQKTLMRQLLSGVEHMHKLWILHRDLKTSNLLLSHTGVLKIADFGLAREYGDPLKRFTPIVVTLWYRSPELLLGTKLYSTPVDIWSVGCIMAEFILLKALFIAQNELDQIKKIFMELGTPNEKIWPGVGELEGMKKLSFENYPYNQLRKKFLSGRLLNDTGFKLLVSLLTYDPKNRISATEALSHEWFEEEPLPTPPEEFPTFPAKSEQNKAPPPGPANNKPVQRIDVVSVEQAKLLKEFSIKPDQVQSSGGFSLKFDNTRF